MEQCAREAPVTGRANRSGTAPLPRRPESPGWLHMHRLRRDLPESISPFPLSIFFCAYPTGCWVGSCSVVWCTTTPNTRKWQGCIIQGTSCVRIRFCLHQDMRCILRARGSRDGRDLFVAWYGVHAQNLCQENLFIAGSLCQCADTSLLAPHGGKDGGHCTC
jgi:hypothetical protein